MKMILSTFTTSIKTIACINFTAIFQTMYKFMQEKNMKMKKFKRGGDSPLIFPHGVEPQLE